MNLTSHQPFISNARYVLSLVSLCAVSAFVTPAGGQSVEQNATEIVPASPSASQAPVSATNPVVVVDVDEHVRLAPAQVVRDAISRELGIPTVAPAAAAASSARGTIRVSADDQRRIVIEYRDSSGNVLWRTVSVPSDPAAALATIAFITGSLARREADELLVQPSASIAPVVAVAPTIIPPVAMPPTAPLPQAASRPTQPDDRHRSILSIYTLVAYGTTGHLTGFGGVLGLDIRIRSWRHLAFSIGVEFNGGTYQTTPGGPVFSDYKMSHRWALVPHVMLNPSFGPFRLEFGLGLGGTYVLDEVFATPVSDSPCVTATVTAGVALAISHHFDLLVRSQTAMQIGISSDAFMEQSQAGLQLRF